MGWHVWSNMLPIMRPNGGCGGGLAFVLRTQPYPPERRREPRSLQRSRGTCNISTKKHFQIVLKLETPKISLRNPISVCLHNCRAFQVIFFIVRVKVRVRN